MLNNITSAADNLESVVIDIVSKFAGKAAEIDSRFCDDLDMDAHDIIVVSLDIEDILKIDLDDVDIEFMTKVRDLVEVVSILTS